MFDNETNTVFFAACLKDRYPDVFSTAKVNLEANGITVKTIPNTQNLWCRDFMPLQVNDHYVKFQYKTVGYDRYLWLQVSDTVWSSMVSPVIVSPLVLDGGGVTRGENQAVVTRKVIVDNKDWKPKKIIAEVERLLELEVIVLPMEPDSPLGHSDGICKFVDEKTILINDYSYIFDKDKRFIKYSEKIIKIFESSGLNVKLLPLGHGEYDWNMTEEEFRKRYPYADIFDPGYGYYINFILVMGLILVPVMGIDMDVKVIQTIKRLYLNYNVVAINCAELSMLGGLINCISWNVKL